MISGMTLIIFLGFTLLSLSILPVLSASKKIVKIIPIIIIFISLGIIWQGSQQLALTSNWIACQPIWLGLGPLAFNFDFLAYLFILILLIITIFSSLISIGYLNSPKNKINHRFYWANFVLFIASMFFIFLAKNALTFLVFWEIMAISSLALVALDFTSTKAQKASLIYLGATKMSTMFLTIGFLWLHQLYSSWDFANWTIGSNATFIPALLLAIGFCIKAGAFPFHIWLPYAHPAAPGPVSALMSGVMIKVAIYGIIRMLLVNAHFENMFFVYFFLLLGAISAIWGIIFAMIQNDIKRSLAYSSVENIGLILIALAISLYGKLTGNHYLEIIGFIAVIFHTINHAVFKSLLFLGISAIDSKIHNHDLHYLGGLARYMPWTFLCFLTGSLSICSLPPLNGFISKWLIYKGLWEIICQSQNKFFSGIIIMIIGLLAMVGALAVLLFTKLIGLMFLGRSRSAVVTKASEVGLLMRISQVSLAFLCFSLALFSPTIIKFITSHSFYQLNNVIPQLPIATLLIVLVSLISIIYFIFHKLSTNTKNPPWSCGALQLSPLMQVNADSYSYSVANFFKPILQYKVTTSIIGSDKRHFPEKIESSVSNTSLIETKIYSPIIKDFEIIGNHFAKLQAGSIHLYLLYVFISLIILLFIGMYL